MTATVTPDFTKSSAPEAAVLSAGEVLHASAVAIEGRGLLILGRSGRGKSALALRLLSYGAGLIADDRVWIGGQGDAPHLEAAEGGDAASCISCTATAPASGRAHDAGLWAACPSAAIRGLIEARGIGILRSPYHGAAKLALVVDLDQPEPDRLPPKRVIELRNHKLPLVLGAQNPHLAEGLLVWMKNGRQE